MMYKDMTDEMLKSFFATTAHTEEQQDAIAAELRSRGYKFDAFTWTKEPSDIYERLYGGKKKMYTADRETGTFIDEVKTVQEGLVLIREYEEADKRDGVFSEGFYDIVDENHCHVEGKE